LLALTFAVPALLMGCNGDDPKQYSPPVDRLGSELTFEETSGLVSTEAENFTANTAQGSHNWTLTSASGASGGNVMIASPNNGAANNTGYTTTSPRLDYQVTFAQSGTYQVWVRGRDTGTSVGNNDSVHVGLDGVATSTSDRISSFTTTLGWSHVDLERAAQIRLVRGVGEPIRFRRHEPVEEGGDLGRRDRAGELLDDLAVLECLDRRNPLHAETLRELLVGVEVGHDEGDVIAARAGRRVERGAGLAGRPPPDGPKYDHHRHLA
jgi:hypothetical protein